MRRLSLFASVLVTLQISTPIFAQTSPATRPAIKIILVGDSTTSQRTGWGGAFCDLKVSDMVACLPMGRGGRSTKTFREEGSWALVLNEVRTGGYADRYVLIELGHNDKNADPSIGTRLTTEFPQNLAQFVDEVRAAGGKPILLTPLASRHFNNGKLADTLGPWAAQVRAVAVRNKTPIIDLNHDSVILYQKLGASGALQFEANQLTDAEKQAAAAGTTLPPRVPAADTSVPAADPRRTYRADYIHLNQQGASQIADIVARGLIAIDPALRTYVFP
jgi:lysophospholipase L1-like esterase